jgi:hypothetical protein
MQGLSLVLLLTLSQAFLAGRLFSAMGWTRTTTTTTTTMLTAARYHWDWNFFPWGVPPPEYEPADPTGVNESHSEANFYIFELINYWFSLVIYFTASIQNYVCQVAVFIECTVVGTIGQVQTILTWGWWTFMFASVLIFFMLSRYLVLYLLVPFSRLLKEIYWYMCGDNTWADVKAAQGEPVTRISWVGPEHRQQWDTQYISTNVRGRGVDRKPCDLLISLNQHVARIRHGDVKGRTTRHGFNLENCAAEVFQCSNRALRTELEAHGCRIHLCATYPCTAIRADNFLHVHTSATIPRGLVLDCSDIAKTAVLLYPGSPAPRML